MTLTHTSLPTLRLSCWYSSADKEYGNRFSKGSSPLGGLGPGSSPACSPSRAPRSPCRDTIDQRRPRRAPVIGRYAPRPKRSYRCHRIRGASTRTTCHQTPGRGRGRPARGPSQQRTPEIAVPVAVPGRPSFTRVNKATSFARSASRSSAGMWCPANAATCSHRRCGYSARAAAGTGGAVLARAAWIPVHRALDYAPLEPADQR